MAYDNSTGTITTDGDLTQFDKDIRAHIAHVESEVTTALRKKHSLVTRVSLLNLARLGNIVFALGICWAFFEDKHSHDGLDVLGLLLILSLPVVNLKVMSHIPGRSTWLSLYFQRKMLEEAKKIRELTGQK